MDLPVLVIIYCVAAAALLFFLLAALRGARRVDEQHDTELIGALEARRDALAKSEALPPLRQRGADEVLPALTEQESTKPPV